MELDRIVQIAYGILNDFQGSIVAIIVLVSTYPILKKKLLENHISKSLTDIQEANKKLLHSCTDLIDQLIPHTYTNDWIYAKEIEYLYSKVNEISNIAQDANQDSNTIIFYLKETLRNTLKHYDPKEHGRISSREMLGIIINVLERAIFFSTQVVPIPKSSKTTKSHLIHKKVRKYVTHSEFERYKYFKQGIIEDSRSAHALLFYASVHSTSTKIITRSAFQVINNIAPISSLLIVREFYAPLILKMDETSPLFGDESILYLMGYKISNCLSTKTGKVTEVIELNYTNPSDFYGFTESLTQDKFIKLFKDDYIIDSQFDLDKMTGFSTHKEEIVSLKFDFSYVHDQFAKNKRKLKRKMRSTVRDSS